MVLKKIKTFDIELKIKKVEAKPHKSGVETFIFKAKGGENVLTFELDEKEANINDIINIDVTISRESTKQTKIPKE